MSFDTSSITEASRGVISYLRIDLLLKMDWYSFSVSMLSSPFPVIIIYQIKLGKSYLLFGFSPEGDSQIGAIMR